MWSLLFVILENTCSLFWKSGTMGNGVYVELKAEAKILKGRPGKRKNWDFWLYHLSNWLKLFLKPDPLFHFSVINIKFTVFVCLIISNLGCVSISRNTEFWYIYLNFPLVLTYIFKSLQIHLGRRLCIKYTYTNTILLNLNKYLFS